jgi:SOS-response transcriptional repressor LexA
MFTVKEILIPRSNGLNLAPVAIGSLEKPFEHVVKEALFAFPYKPDNYYFVVSVQGDSQEETEDEFLLIIDPDLKPAEGDLFIFEIDDVPSVRKFVPRLHDEYRILGTVAHASKAPAINIE